MVVVRSKKPTRNYGYGKFVFFLSIGLGLGTSCAYNFSNLGLKPRAGIETIGIEAIYDTSHTPIPHEILWTSLQRAFASNGQLRLSSIKKADLYLRTHIEYSSQNQQNTQTNPILKDPKDIRDEEGNVRPFSQYSNLRVADQYSKEEAVSLGLVVELWDRRRRKLIFSKRYNPSGTYLIVTNRIPIESQFLRAEEGFATWIRRQSDSVAGQIVYAVLQAVH